MKKYKISEVSQMTDIPIVTIRYFEEMGIVSPQRVNTYRYYTEKDVYNLLEYKKMRSYGMPAGEILSFFHIQSMEEYAEKFNMLRAEYDRKSRYYKCLEECTEESVQIMQNIEQYIGRFCVREIIERRYVDFYFNGKNTGEEQIWMSWIHEYYPFVEYMMIFEKESGQGCKWVNAIRSQIIRQLDIPVSGDISTIERHKAVFTVAVEEGNRQEQSFCSSGGLPLPDQYLAEHGYVQDGNIVGKLLARTEENHREKLYMGYWIPIR